MVEFFEQLTSIYMYMIKNWYRNEFRAPTSLSDPMPEKTRA